MPHTPSHQTPGRPEHPLTSFGVWKGPLVHPSTWGRSLVPAHLQTFVSSSAEGLFVTKNYLQSKKNLKESSQYKIPTLFSLLLS